MNVFSEAQASLSSDDAQPVQCTTVDAVFQAELHTSLEAVSPLWRVLEKDCITTPYQRRDWLSTVVAHLAGPAASKPLFVTVTDQSGRVVMLVPLALATRQGCRVVTWLDLGVCDYAIPVRAKGFEPTVSQIEAIWQAVCNVLPYVDLILIERIPVQTCGRKNPLAALPYCSTMAMEASGIPLAGDPDTVLDRTCRPSVIRDLNYKRRRLERAGAVRFVQATSPDEVDAIFCAMVEQRLQRFAEMGRFDLLAHPEVRAFYHAAALDGLTGGPARLFGLSVNEAWIATGYGLVHEDTFYYIIPTNLVGEWKTSSPGLQMTAETIRWASSQGFQRYDFTVGLLPYKRDFGAESCELRALMQPLTSKGTALQAGLRATDRAKTWLKTTSLFQPLQKARRYARKLGV